MACSPDTTHSSSTCASLRSIGELEHHVARKPRHGPAENFLKEMKVTDDAYRERRHEAEEEMQSYARRIEALRERTVASVDERGRKSVTITVAAAMTASEIMASIHVVMPERSTFASMLNRRQPSEKMGIRHDESYVVRRESTGFIQAKVLRGVLSQELAVEAERMSHVHDRVSVGWFGGCEAAQRIIAQVCCPM